MRRLLDTLYTALGGLAALSMLAICLFVSVQVGLNITGIPRNLAAWIGTFGLSPYALLALFAVLLITLFPAIVTSLPSAMGN